MPRSRSRLPWLWLLAMLAASDAAFAQGWNQPAHDLAAKIVALTPPRAAVSLTVHNLSSMDEADLADARSAVESQLRSLGIRLVSPAEAASDVDLTFSESAGSYLWVAQIGRGEPRDVVMVSAPLLSATPYRGGLMTIRRTPLVTEPVPILDVVSVANPPSLLVLDVEGIKLYRLFSGGPTVASSQPIFADRPLPRDLRGHLAIQDNGFIAFLPGTQCSGQWAPLLSLSCHASDDPWPLPTVGTPPVRAFFSASRDFFAGPLSPALASNPAPFYSAGRLTAGDNSSLWLFAATDGMAHLVNAGGQTVANFPGWGSDLATANSACGGSQYVLASSPSASEQPDTIRAYQLSGRKMTAISEPLEFPGPITALWTQPDGSSVLAVSKNLKTGDYEASSLAAACGR